MDFFFYKSQFVSYSSSVSAVFKSAVSYYGSDVSAVHYKEVTAIVTERISIFYITQFGDLRITSHSDSIYKRYTCFWC